MKINQLIKYCHSKLKKCHAGFISASHDTKLLKRVCEDKNLVKSAYTMAEIMVVSAMILVAIAYMVSTLRNKLPDTDKTTIRNAYGQVSQIVSNLSQLDAYPYQGFANHTPFVELVYSNGQSESVICSTCPNLTQLNQKINETKNNIADRISGATLLKEEKFYGGTKFASLFKTELNIKEDNIEDKVNAENTVPICYTPNNKLEPKGTFNDPFDSQTKNKMTCFKTNKGITYCLPNNTNDANCLGNYSAAQADKYNIVVKIFIDDKYKNEDGYYLQVSPIGKISILPPSKITYGPNNSLQKSPTSFIDCYGVEAEQQALSKGEDYNYDKSDYNTYKQCRLNTYLLYSNPGKDK